MNEESATELTEGYFRWRCRRGMKELDFILNRFLDSQFWQLSDAQKFLLNNMLDEEDMLLWYWLSGKSQPDTANLRFKDLVEQICAAGYLKK